jgi:hypothetical protein
LSPNATALFGFNLVTKKPHSRRSRYQCGWLVHPGPASFMQGLVVTPFHVGRILPHLPHHLHWMLRSVSSWLLFWFPIDYYYISLSTHQFLKIKLCIHSTSKASKQIFTKNREKISTREQQCCVELKRHYLLVFYIKILYQIWKSPQWNLTKRHL